MAPNNFLIVLKDLNRQQFDLFLLFFSKNRDRIIIFFTKCLKRSMNKALYEQGRETSPNPQTPKWHFSMSHKHMYFSLSDHRPSGREWLKTDSCFFTWLSMQIKQTCSCWLLVNCWTSQEKDRVISSLSMAYSGHRPAPPRHGGDGPTSWLDFSHWLGVFAWNSKPWKMFHTTALSTDIPP